MLERQPDIVLVYGDVNSTVATVLVCAKLGVRVGHVEAGLRSFDRTMPEEINRLVTDQLADLLFTPSEDGDENLRREGIPAGEDFPRRQRDDRLARAPFASGAEDEDRRAARPLCVGHASPSGQC